MFWSWRKSVKIGGVRINASRAGLGWSAGAGGFRVGQRAGGGNKRAASGKSSGGCLGWVVIAFAALMVLGWLGKRSEPTPAPSQAAPQQAWGEYPAPARDEPPGAVEPDPVPQSGPAATPDEAPAVADDPDPAPETAAAEASPSSFSPQYQAELKKTVENRRARAKAKADAQAAARAKSAEVLQQNLDALRDTSTGTIYTGPRGGRYHISPSGKKVYEKR